MMRALLTYRIEWTDRHPLRTGAAGIVVLYLLAIAGKAVLRLVGLV